MGEGLVALVPPDHPQDPQPYGAGPHQLPGRPPAAATRRPGRLKLAHGVSQPGATQLNRWPAAIIGCVGHKPITCSVVASLRGGNLGASQGGYVNLEVGRGILFWGASDCVWCGNANEQ